MSCLISTLVPRSPAVLSPFFVLDPTSPHLASTALRTFKQALLDKLLRQYSTSFAELDCPFLPLDLLPNKTKHKQTFDTVFVNSRSLADNYIQEDVDLSFAECGRSIGVKLNWLW